jgi:hypothetical protein
MNLTRAGSQPSNKGPSDWFTAWYTHPPGQYGGESAAR